VVTSIGGLNERWAQIAALQPPQAVQPGRDGAPRFGNDGTATTDLPPVSPVAGSTAAPLSNDTNFLLTIFGATQSPTRAPNGPASNGPPPNGPAPSGPASARAPEQNPASAAAQSQPDAQLSLFVPTVNAGADGITGSTLVQELQALASGGRGGANAGSVASPSSGPPGGSDAIENSDTAAPSWHNGWDNTIGPGNRGRQQLGLAAYTSGDFAGQSSATASVLQGVSA
jgi:hypothetical protein